MVLFNFILGIFCFSSIFVMWAFSFFYVMEVMKGGKQLTGLQISTRLLFCGLATLGLMLSGMTLRGGVTGLSAFIGLGTIPLLSVSIIVLMGSMLYLLYSFYKNKQGTISFWQRVKNSIDGFFSFFDSTRKTESAIQEFESKLSAISTSVKSFNNQYENSVAQLISLRNNMTVAEAVDASGRWKSQSKEFDKEIPVIKQIIAAITFAGEAQAPVISGIDIREQVQSQGKQTKPPTYEEFSDVLGRFFRVGNSSLLINSANKYVVKSKNGVIERYLGEFAENTNNNYLECPGLFLFEGSALLYLLKNTEVTLMVDIEIMSKPEKNFTRGENISIEGKAVTQETIVNKINYLRTMEQQKQGNQVDPAARTPLNLSMPNSSRI